MALRLKREDNPESEIKAKSKRILETSSGEIRP